MNQATSHLTNREIFKGVVQSRKFLQKGVWDKEVIKRKLKIYWRKVRIQVINYGSSFADLQYFTLAELIAGHERNLPSSFRSSKVVMLPVWECKVYSTSWDLWLTLLSVGVSNWYLLVWGNWCQMIRDENFFYRPSWLQF